MTTAFQPSAFANNAFQIEGAGQVCFVQQNAVQINAFQPCFGVGRRRAGSIEGGRRRYITRRELEEQFAKQRAFTPRYWIELNAAWAALEEAERRAEALKKAKLEKIAREAAYALDAVERAGIEAEAEVAALQRAAEAAAVARTASDAVWNELARAAEALRQLELLIADDDEAIVLLLS